MRLRAADRQQLLARIALGPASVTPALAGGVAIDSAVTKLFAGHTEMGLRTIGLALRHVLVRACTLGVKLQLDHIDALLTVALALYTDQHRTLAHLPDAMKIVRQTLPSMRAVTLGSWFLSALQGLNFLAQLLSLHDSVVEPRLAHSGVLYAAIVAEPNSVISSELSSPYMTDFLALRQDVLEGIPIDASLGVTAIGRPIPVMSVARPAAVAAAPAAISAPAPMTAPTSAVPAVRYLLCLSGDTVPCC